MSGADEMLRSATRLAAALERIATGTERLRAEAAKPDAAPSPSAEPPRPASDADIAERLDSLIEELRIALSATPN